MKRCGNPKKAFAVMRWRTEGQSRLYCIDLAIQFLILEALGYDTSLVEFRTFSGYIILG